jgi:hypothetical protein
LPPGGGRFATVLISTLLPCVRRMKSHDRTQANFRLGQTAVLCPAPCDLRPCDFEFPRHRLVGNCIAAGNLSFAALLTRAGLPCPRRAQSLPRRSRIITITKSKPRPPLGPYPQLLLCPHVGNTPTKARIRIIRRMVPRLMDRGFAEAVPLALTRSDERPFKTSAAHRSAKRSGNCELCPMRACVK